MRFCRYEHIRSLHREQAAEHVERYCNGDANQNGQAIHVPHVLGSGGRELRVPAHPLGGVQLQFNAPYSFAWTEGRFTPDDILYQKESVGFL